MADSFNSRQSGQFYNFVGTVGTAYFEAGSCQEKCFGKNLLGYGDQQQGGSFLNNMKNCLDQFYEMKIEDADNQLIQEKNNQYNQKEIADHNIQEIKNIDQFGFKNLQVESADQINSIFKPEVNCKFLKINAKAYTEKRQNRYQKKELQTTIQCHYRQHLDHKKVNKNQRERDCRIYKMKHQMRLLTLLKLNWQRTENQPRIREKERKYINNCLNNRFLNYKKKIKN
ncbi:unnamed protein product [Paramecium pentaurelia]|uniref:Uncharacterized protein n=1 Tax=Paramecium pentaurelia TaxID=43138 RepID=A0A8S1SIN8_9CILI|nr:unnamed protein product [Paramecium pentaurelia]